MSNKLFILSGLLFFGCSTLKKQSSKSKVESRLEVAQKNNQFFGYKSALLSIDSSNAVDEVLIWPKGMVKYTLAGGFEGEVKKMSLRSKNLRKQVQVQSQQGVLVQQSDLKAKQATRVVKEAELKVKTSTRFYAIGMLLFVLLGSFIYLCYKRKFG